ARDYSMSDVVIAAQLHSDGSMQVTEARTFTFSGSFNEVFWDLDHTGHDLKVDAVGITALSSREATQTGATPVAQSDADIDGTIHYRLTQKDANTTELSIFKPVTDESVRYVITYTVSDLIERHPDTAMLYWSFIASHWEKPVNRVEATILLPAGAAVQKSDLRAWAHGSLTGTVTIRDDGSIHLAVDDLPAKTPLSVRALYPPTLFPDATLREGEIKPGILAQEQELSDQANAARRRARILEGFYTYGIPALALVIIAVLVVIWFLYGKEYPDQKPFAGEYWREDPAPDLSPALIGAIWRMGKTEPLDFSATILQLVDSGVITLTQAQVQETRFFGLSDTFVKVSYFQIDRSKTADLSPIEHKAVALLTQVAGASGVAADQPPGSFTIDDLKAYAQSHRSAYREAWTDWQDTVTKLAEARYIEHRSVAISGAVHAIRGVAAFVIFAMLFVSPGVFMSLFTHLPAVLSGVAVLAASAIFGRLILRRSHEGNRLYHYYHGIYRYLKDFSRMEEKPVASVVLWNRYLVLATIFGIADEVAADLKVALPEMVNDPAFAPTFIWFYAGGLHVAAGQSFSGAFSSALTSAQVAATPNSSGGGFGGGFSGGFGGGGFGGGGGGGAR
ncbi:MAG: DUF2207 domain-containing protein, partial [Actinomycetia bacterium]|nr:DUF2207 domain-containing protein [Actinomycetes bacterium]